MTFRIAFLLFAATALTLTGCAQQQWQEATASSSGAHVKTAKKQPKDPPEENDSDEPKYDLLR